MIARPTRERARRAPGLERRLAVPVVHQSIWLAGLFGLALLVRLYRLDAQSLWLDEGSTWQMIQAGWGALFADLFNPTSAYPLYHVLLKAWSSLFGDSEWALRLPSALSGAAAVVGVYLAAQELAARRAMQLYPAGAALLALAAPFAIWYAQEAKVYSLLLLMAALLLWSTLRVVHYGARRDWLLLGGLALTSIFVHRLALLLVLATWTALVLTGELQARRRWLGAIGVAAVLVVTAMAFGVGADRAATGAYIPADPAMALGLTFVRFSIDRWPGDAPWWWLLPWAGLALGGVIMLALRWRTERSAYQTPASGRKERRGIIVLLCFLLIPTLLFLVQLLFTRLYEARYLILVLPAWLLVLAYPLTGLSAGRDAAAPTGGENEVSRGPAAPATCAGPGRDAATQSGGKNATRQNRAAPAAVWRWLYSGMLLAALATSGLALVQPEKGLFSGYPVKEQYRAAFATLAARLQPDDAVVLHPSYLRPLYDYYMPRLSADPAPEPIGFANFWRGETTYTEREWNIERSQKLAGYNRSFLVIAPDHARTVDPPQPGDEYGLVGLWWAFSSELRTWPCGIDGFVGVDLLCQAAPEAYITGVTPQPETLVNARFGSELQLLGYTLKATTPAGPGTYRAGGNLPITLFWDVTQTPDENYSFFLHLCRECDLPPPASSDGPPLDGYLPTSVWLPGKPARDDRAIVLPEGLPPGRYTLLLGAYRPGDPAPTARLTVAGDQVLENNRLVLGTVEVVGAQ